MKLTAALGALAAPALALCLTLPALAQPLQPAKPVDAQLYTGRWYEIARTPNAMQSDCQGSTTDFTNSSGGAFLAVQTCHKGAASGPASVTRVHGKVLPASANAKMQLAMLGGLITQQYWILDHAADSRWLIMATPNGKYVWLMARRPTLAAADKTAVMAKLAALGFNAARLTFPQPARA
jgi:apolipoprotein D and lipocalin family protein